MERGLFSSTHTLTVPVSYPLLSPSETGAAETAAKEEEEEEEGQFSLVPSPIPLLSRSQKEEEIAWPNVSQPLSTNFPHFLPRCFPPSSSSSSIAYALSCRNFISCQSGRVWNILSEEYDSNNRIPSAVLSLSTCWRKRMRTDENRRWGGSRVVRSKWRLDFPSSIGAPPPPLPRAKHLGNYVSPTTTISHMNRHRHS